MFSPLHRFQKALAEARRPCRVDRRSIALHVRDIPLAVLLSYKIILAGLWVVSVVVWLVLQILPARPATLDASDRSLREVSEQLTEATLVSEGTTLAERNELEDEN